MKKIIYILFAFVGFLASCTNDDIEITQAYTVTVDPSQVIAPFTFEWKTGELESFDSSYKLRVTVLAYDEQGVLKSSATQYLTNYASLANCALQLSKGKYSIIAITTVVEMNGSNVKTEYWKIEDTQSLTTTKVEDAGLIGGKYKILGIARQTVQIEGKESGISMKPKPAGALCFVYWMNIHTFTDVTRYKLLMNKTSDYVLFNNSEGYEPSIENNNGSYDWRLCYLDPQDNDYTNYSNIYAYYFTLPMNNVYFKYVYNTSSTTNSNINSGKCINLEAGKEYGFVLNLKDSDTGNITYSIGEVLNSTSKSSAKQQSMTSMKWNRSQENILYLKDFDVTK